MKFSTKKQIYLLVLFVFVATAVYILFPFGDKLLLIVRNQDTLYEIEHGKEVIYTYFDRGDIRVADEILQNNYELSRFEPVEIATITWDEDPFSDIYWRFNFYNLEPVRNLLYAWGSTGEPKYKDKLIEITTSFIDTGMDGQYSWDSHGVAFRTMTLVDVWGKLDIKNELPEDLNVKMLQSLEIHGNFLADPDHFEKAYNHGLDQSVALYLLAINFPDMPNADSWLEISSNRISELLVGIVDDDGVLVENSPYYHFYVLEKFWEIDKYLKENNLFISPHFDEKIDKMISYATYILQPDLKVPTIGASLGGDIRLAGVYKEMAKSHPNLLYVLTKGVEGSQPKKLNIQYTDSGQTIMRSGFGEEDTYSKQTQLIFDIGSYRTHHSDLDALSFSLYSNGLSLMPDAGLYTYDAGQYRSYFHGTRSHNTVVVDGKDQVSGMVTTGRKEKVYAGFFEEGDGYVYQSGAHELYDGVSHKRVIVMIEDSTILIVDNLRSSTEHIYEQMFHLFPGAEVSTDGLTLVAKGESPEQTVTIRQYITDSMELSSIIDGQDPLDGICSSEYKVSVPCYAISYLQKGQNVSYVTAISIGSNLASIVLEKDNGIIEIETKDSVYEIKVNETKGVERSIVVKKNFDISNIYSFIQSASSLNALEEWYISEVTDEEYTDNTHGGSVSVNKNENSLEIIPPTNGSYFEVMRDVHIDLSNDNIYFKIKINKISNLSGLDLYLSNNKWGEYNRYNIESSSYDVNRDNEWLQFGVGKGDLREVKLGGWEKNSSSFDWSQIDGIKFVASSNESSDVKISISDFNLVPDQKEARAVIIFDDGWSSVLDAAKIMNKYGMKGNVPIITDSVGTKRYLTLTDLEMLQNTYGWNIVNHTSLHKDAVDDYVNRDNIKGYLDDVTDALQYLIKNNINSAPNWFIYPHGKTNGLIKEIVGKYYKFARATVDGPELFPFAEPLEVKVFSVYSDRANTTDVHNAVRDAVENNQTIMLMFHKFSAGIPSVYTELQLSEFDVILKDMKEQGIKVVTLSELDKENGIPDTEFTVHEFVPQQFVLDISTTHPTKSPFNFFEVLNVLRTLI